MLSARRLLTALLVTAAALAAVPVAATADDSSTLTVVGTSDVNDSGLMPLLIKPAFQAAYPQYTLNYVSLGTGAAINFAEAGTASGLPVHAASLENQFVQQGYSAEPYGRAIFWGDYVLLGPASDPAGVMSNHPHDIASAFEAIAAAGAAGNADFVSRANTSGTAVQEHAIWGLTDPSASLTLCPVSTGNGGGQAPTTTNSPCPGTPSYPSWYHATGVTQGPNIENANTCNYTNATNHGANDCYVFTDRGTFNCLQDANCRGAAGAPDNLQIVARANDASARGGGALLVNSFHAYALNPDKFAGQSGVQINKPAAIAFLNFVTSAGFQAQLKNFLGGTNGAPFIADAAPKLTASPLPAKVTAGHPVTVTGTVSNVVPGTPPLAGQPVKVSQIAGLAAGVPVGSGRTDGDGNYSITFSPPSNGNYQVSTGTLTQIENRSLSPIFGDLLQPTATPASHLDVQSAIGGFAVNPAPGKIVASGSVLPGSGHANAKAILLVHRVGNIPFRRAATQNLATSAGTFAIASTLAAGRWQVEVRFQDNGQVLSSTAGPRTVTVPPAPTGSTAATLSIRKLTITSGRVRLDGAVSPKTPKAGTHVQLLGLDTGPAHAGSRFVVLARGTLRKGATRFTLRARLRRQERWIMQLAYLPGGGRAASYGKLRSVRVG